MSESKNKKNKVIHISPMGELLFWLLIILVVVAISSLTFTNKMINDENDYQIFMPDVDGLIVGSPVRMLGIEIGHVTKIEPTGDEVYINFIIKNPDIYLPQGTQATVEFSGMAGSKSLELYPPDRNSYIDENTPILSILPPKRLHDALDLLNQMYKKLTSIIYTTSSFGNKLDSLEIGTHEKSDFNEFLKFSNVVIDDANIKANNIKDTVNRRGYGVK